MVKSLPFADIYVPSPCFGTMGLSFNFGSNLSLEEAEPVLLKAIQLECTFWDTAVSYRAAVNEKLLKDLIRKHIVRDMIFIASKCGFDVFEDGSGTIERLGFTPDLYYLHRELIAALDEIRKAGRKKYIGLSECSAKTLRTANSIARIDAVQAEYSTFETINEQDGLIQACKELGITYVAYGPLGYGWLVDDSPYKSPDDFAADDFRRQRCILDFTYCKKMKRISSRRNCALSQVALAWVTAQGMIAIPGTTKATRLEENWASRDIELRNSWKSEGL
ncbi:NADP-dependent oxidoreductase domain-containing protein [Aspergillus stella-maris]|uniref:NADP-dependent oxidoreductase domain-containing protein n=1 Tax=Aspergillus stella-maris TaxID=1810926 RepID=UPI003CCD0557